MLKVSGFSFFTLDIFYNSLPPGETLPCRHTGVHFKQTNESANIKFPLIFLSDSLHVKAQRLLALVTEGTILSKLLFCCCQLGNSMWTRGFCDVRQPADATGLILACSDDLKRPTSPHTYLVGAVKKLICLS